MNIFILLGLGVLGFGVYQEISKTPKVKTETPPKKNVSVTDPPIDTKPKEDELPKN